MLLVMDVGNTNTVLGLYQDETLLASWRLTTNRAQTTDEYALLVAGLFSLRGVDQRQVTDAIVSSVVPPMDSTIRETFQHHYGIDPLFVGPGLKTGMPIQYDSPADVGADRIVNAVAGYARYGGPLIIVDFGTATTFDVVSVRGEYAGGIICPGLGIAAEALFSRTAKLPRVDIRRPARLIATNTVGSIQSGLYYGYLGLVDGLIERLLQELGSDTRVIATGGLAELIGRDSRYISECDPMLTLEGLRLIWQKNRG